MPDKRYYLACLDLDGRPCLVVGGGPVGLEKARGLLDCGARVTVVASTLEPELERLPIRWRRKRYDATDLDGQLLVVAATESRSLNRRISRDAEARSLLCNVVDTPELCSFILPAVYRRDPIALAVSTGGASPALAKRLRDELGRRITDEHVELARRLRELRPWVRAHYSTYHERRAFFEQLVASWVNPESPPSSPEPPEPPRPPAGHLFPPASSGPAPATNAGAPSTSDREPREAGG